MKLKKLTLIFLSRTDRKTYNKAKHSDGFSLRLRLHYKAARAGGVMCVDKV